MKKIKIYTLPESYTERQRIIKALQDPSRELVLWYYDKPILKEEGEDVLLWGVYLNKDNKLCVYYYDIETLQRQGMGYLSGQTPNEESEPDLNNIYNWLHRKGGITNLLGYVLGVQCKPPKPEGKIIQFPVIEAKRRKQRGTA